MNEILIRPKIDPNELESLSKVVLRIDKLLDRQGNAQPFGTLNMGKSFILRVFEVVMLAVVLVGSVSAVEGMGLLQIEGVGVERIVLIREGKEEEFTLKYFDEPVELAVGKYQVWKIGLMHCHYTFGRRDMFIEIREGETCVFKAGGPMTHSVKVNGRRGRFLELGYEMKGIDGRGYRTSHRRHLPKLEVYKDGKRIGGGLFEYG